MPEAAKPGRGLVNPFHDERYRADPSRRGGPCRGIWLPPGSIGEPLLLYGQRPPDSLEECFWRAGQKDGLYLCDTEDDTDAEGDGEFRCPGHTHRLAIRSEAGSVSTKAFGGEWTPVGTIEQD